MLIELVGGPGDGHVVERDNPPPADYWIPISAPPSVAPWNVHQIVGGEIETAHYRLTVRPPSDWIYVYAEQYIELVKRWR